MKTLIQTIQAELERMHGQLEGLSEADFPAFEVQVHLLADMLAKELMLQQVGRIDGKELDKPPPRRWN